MYTANNKHHTDRCSPYTPTLSLSGDSRTRCVSTVLQYWTPGMS